jgi:hypothetical protein
MFVLGLGFEERACEGLRYQFSVASFQLRVKADSLRE